MWYTRIVLIVAAALVGMLCDASEHKSKRKSLVKRHVSVSRSQPIVLGESFIQQETISEALHQASIQRDVARWRKLLSTLSENSKTDEARHDMYEIACMCAINQGWAEGALQVQKFACLDECPVRIFPVKKEGQNIAQACIDKGKLALLHDLIHKGGNLVSSCDAQATFNCVFNDYVQGECTIRDMFKDGSNSAGWQRVHEKHWWQRAGLQYLNYSYQCVLGEQSKEKLNDLEDVLLKGLLLEEKLTDEERKTKLDALLRSYGRRKGSQVELSNKERSMHHKLRATHSVHGLNLANGSEQASQEAVESTGDCRRSKSMPSDLSDWMAKRGGSLAQSTKKQLKKAGSALKKFCSKTAEVVESIDVGSLLIAGAAIASLGAEE